MMLVNGHSEHCIDCADRGLQYGDGLFETIRVIEGRPVFFDRHYQRLQQGCQRLLLPCPDFALLQAEALSLTSAKASGVLKIILTRGRGGRGYRLPEVVDPTRILALYPFPEYPPAFQQQGVNVRFCQTRLGLNPTLAGIKHLNRLEQVLARAEWQEATIQEGLMLDMNGHVIEGTMSNLFYVKDQTLVTAPVTHSGVAGIMRGRVLGWVARQGMAVAERNFFPEELLAADEVFLTNAIIGIWPVCQIEQHKFALGELTRHIMFDLDTIEGN